MYSVPEDAFILEDNNKRSLLLKLDVVLAFHLGGTVVDCKS